MDTEDLTPVPTQITLIYRFLKVSHCKATCDRNFKCSCCGVIVLCICVQKQFDINFIFCKRYRHLTLQLRGKCVRPTSNTLGQYDIRNGDVIDCTNPETDTFAMHIVVDEHQPQSCFVAGTMVVLADGSEIAIETVFVIVGDVMIRSLIVSIFQKFC